MNWKDFAKRQESQSNSTAKGNDFEKLAKIYLTKSPNFPQLKQAWLIDDLPERIRKKLNHPTRDMGIDIVCQTKNDEYWAVQAKYDKNHTKNDTLDLLSTTFALTWGLGTFDHLLVCTTHNGFVKIIEEFRKKHSIGFISGDRWRNLEDVYFDILNGKAEYVPLTPFKPYLYQEPAVNKTVGHLKKKSRGKLIMPCGSGKSLTSYWISQKLKSKRIIFAVPSIYLIKQTYEFWLREIVANKKNYSIQIVCSDTTTAKIDEDSELKTSILDLEVPVETNVDNISTWLGKHKRKNIIVFTTYKSGKTLSKAAKKANINFDLGIFDEAHKTVGRKDKESAHLIFDKNIKIKKRLFMTATERFYHGKKNNISSMDNEKYYGDICHQLTFREAIEMSKSMNRPILSDYQLHTIQVRRSEVEECIRKNVFVTPKRGSWDDDVQTRFLISLIAIRKAIKYLGINHVLSFHLSLSRAEAFSESQEIFSKHFPKYGDLHSGCIKGTFPSSKRKQIIDEFVNEDYSLLTNARCLTEGIDVPKIDCVLFADPKGSKIDIVQAMGRALRYHKGKKLGYIILPIIIEDDDESRKEKQYQEILKVIRHLASNDSRIIDYIKDKIKGTGDGRDPIIKIDEYIDGIDLKDFDKDLTIRIHESLHGLSWMPFNEARTYVSLLGLKNQTAWNVYIKTKDVPNDMPHNPAKHYDEFYPSGGWGYWLGTGNISNQLKHQNYADYQTAEKFARSLMLGLYDNWKLYVYGKIKNKPKKPDSIPKWPNDVYEEFTSWSVFLGSGIYSYKSGYTYSEAKEVIHPLGLTAEPQFKDWKNEKREDLIPFDTRIPKKPDTTYREREEWVSWPDFLGYDLTNPRGYWDLKTSREYIRELQLKDYNEFFNWRDGKLEKDKEFTVKIPNNPQNFYRHHDRGWPKKDGWVYFLSIPLNKPGIRYGIEVSYDEIKEYVHQKNFTSRPKYNKWLATNRPKWFPSNPDKFYADEWESYPEFIGYKGYRTYADTLLPFDEVVEYINSCKNVKNGKQWNDYYKENKSKIPKGIPRNIPSRYPKDSTSWEDIIEDYSKSE